MATAPGYLPAAVERIFLQAEENRIAKRGDAAGSMYRKSLDVGTQLREPELAGKPLAARLKSMREAGLLTPDIDDWATHVRLIGNEATHESNEPTPAEIDDLANLTRMVLVYLFEMPERVRLMRERKAGAGIDAER